MRSQSMKAGASIIRFIAVVAVALGVLCLLSACGQSGDSQSADNATSAESQSSESAEPSDGQAERSLLDTAKDVAEQAKEKATDLTEGAKEKAAEMADAAAKAKEEADRKAEEQKKQREEAEARTAEELEKAELAQKTKKLEYSAKMAKPLNLVECSDSKIEVTSDGNVDLSELGSKTVAYTLSLDGQSIKREMKFEVLDTKAPQIDFVSKKPKVEVGTDYDPIQNINFVKDPVDGELALVDKAPDAQGSKAGEEVFYDSGWYTVDGSVDTSVTGVYSIDVNSSDIHGNTAHRTFDVTVVAPEPEAGAAAQAPDVHKYVLNTNSLKFHFPDCRSVKQMNDSNRWDVEKTRDEVIAMGYEPCGICHP